MFIVSYIPVAFNKFSSFLLNSQHSWSTKAASDLTRTFMKNLVTMFELGQVKIGSLAIDLSSYEGKFTEDEFKTIRLNT